MRRRSGGCLTYFLLIVFIIIAIPYISRYQHNSERRRSNAERALNNAQKEKQTERKTEKTTESQVGRKVEETTENQTEKAGVSTEILTEVVPEIVTEKQTEHQTESQTERQIETRTEKETERILSNNTSSVDYSTNDEETAKNGNTGVFSYKSSGDSYDNYYIIDFEEGYVYFFSDGNDNETCERLKINSGNLNSVLIVTYHDGEDVWQNGLHFRWKNQPDHMILQDNYGTETDFYTTDLNKALEIKNTKRIVDY